MIKSSLSRKKVFKIEDNKKSAGAHTADVIRTVLVYILALCIVAGAVIFVMDRSPDKSLFGYRYYTVLTPSMEPALETGDVVVVSLKDKQSINPGDIITFNPSGDKMAYLTHRVTEKIDDYEGTGVTCFKTKGDANLTEDGFVLDSTRVIGKVCFHIPVLGYVIRFVQLKWYFVLAFIILLYIFFRLLKIYFGDEEKKSAG